MAEQAKRPGQPHLYPGGTVRRTFTLDALVLAAINRESKSRNMPAARLANEILRSGLEERGALKPQA